MLKKLSKSKIYCLISVAIIFGSYIIQKFLHVYFDITRNFALVEAIVFSALTFVVIFILSKSKETFYSILTAIFGFRMMPPIIKQLGALAPEANIVYILVQKFALIIFALAIYKFYKEQVKPRPINAFPILCTMTVVPFFTEIQDQLTPYIAKATEGNMLYIYFSGFALYTIALIILLFVAVRSNPISARIVIDYELVALLLNICRRGAVVVILLSQNQHVSKSYYCWMAISAFFFVIFAVLRKKKLATTQA